MSFKVHVLSWYWQMKEERKSGTVELPVLKIDTIKGQNDIYKCRDSILKLIGTDQGALKLLEWTVKIYHCRLRKSAARIKVPTCIENWKNVQKESEHSYPLFATHLQKKYINIKFKGKGGKIHPY